MKSGAILLMTCNLKFSTNISTNWLCIISYLIQFFMRFNSLQPTVYHITLYNEMLLGTFCQVIILEMLKAFTIHNSLYTFYVTVNVYKTAAYCNLYMTSIEN
jgi:regulator of sigma D